MSAGLKIRRSTTVTLCAVALAAVVVGGCGKSNEQTAQEKICSSRDNIAQQIDKLTSLTLSTGTVDTVKSSLQSIQDDLKQINDARGDLKGERKSQAESAVADFESQLKSIAGGLTSNLSITNAKSQITTAGKQLKSAFQTAFARLDCGGGATGTGVGATTGATAGQ